MSRNKRNIESSVTRGRFLLLLHTAFQHILMFFFHVETISEYTMCEIMFVNALCAIGAADTKKTFSFKQAHDINCRQQSGHSLPSDGIRQWRRLLWYLVVKVSLRIHYCKKDEVYFTTLLWRNNRRRNGLVQFFVTEHQEHLQKKPLLRRLSPKMTSISMEFASRS